MDLDVRRFQPFARPDEAAAMRDRVAQQAFAGQTVFHDLAEQRQAARHRVDRRHTVLEAGLTADHVVILHVLADARQLVQNGYADILQHLALADAGDFKELGAFHGAGREDDFLADLDGALDALLDEFDADGALAFEQDFRGHGARLDDQVVAVHDRVEEGDGSGTPQAVARRHLEPAGAFLVAVVEVVLVSDAGLDTGIDQRLADWMMLGEIGYAQLAAGAVGRDVATLLVFALLEIWEHIVPGPAFAAHLAPAVIVGRLPTHIEKAIQRRGPAEDLALGPFVGRPPEPASTSVS